MKTTTINTLATKFNITFDAARRAVDGASLIPVSELSIGKRTYKLYDTDIAEPVVATFTAGVNKKRQDAAAKRLKKMRTALGAPPAINDDKLMAIELKIDALIVAVNKLSESSLSAVEFT